MKQNKTSIHPTSNHHKIITTKKILKLKKIKKRKIILPKAHNFNFCMNEIKMQDKIIKNESNLGNNSFQKVKKDLKPISEDFNILKNKNDKIITDINNKENNIILLNDNINGTKETLLSTPKAHIPSSLPKNDNLEFSFHPFNLFSSPLYDIAFRFNDFEDMILNENYEFESYHNPFNIGLSEPILNWDALNIENPPNNGSNNPSNNLNNSIRNENNPQNSNTNNNILSNNNNQNNNNNINSDSEDVFSFDFSIILDDFIFNRNRQRTNSHIIKSIKNKLNRKRFKKSSSSNNSLNVL